MHRLLIAAAVVAPLSLSHAISSHAASTGRAALAPHCSTAKRCKITVTAADFINGGVIPRSHEGNDFGCKGKNIPPHITWSSLKGARSYVLTMIDHDAPAPGGFGHWVIYDLPASVYTVGPSVPSVSIQGKDDAGKVGYFGPCPPAGEKHHYTITVWALDILHLHPSARTAAAVTAAAKPHAFGKGTIVGTFKL